MSFSSSRAASGQHEETRLKLGVKGRLSNQEMEQLKHQLATAVAYDHVSDDKRAERLRAKPTSTPMTRVYRKLESEPASRGNVNFRPSIKPKAAIEYEKKFTEGSYDALRMRPPPKGMGDAAKTVLQDDYIMQPREISVIPRNKHTENGESVRVATSQVGAATGKRHAAAAIPQVVIM